MTEHALTAESLFLSPSTEATARGAASSSYRWVVLGAFSLVAGLSQLLWLNYAPLLTTVQAKYGVSEGRAGLLLLVFPLVYVLLSVTAGKLTDRRGYKFSVGLGAVLMAAFSCLRIFDGSFWVLLIAQTGIAVGQPFAVNGISKLVSDWFSREQSAIATGLGTMGMFIGMAAGMAATPPLVAELGTQGAMAAFAALSIVICAAFLLLARNNPNAKPVAAAAEPTMMSLLKNRKLVLLFAIAFLGLGFFNGLTTWLEPILAPNGFDAVKAGAIGGVLIVGGIVGAIIVPALSDWLRVRKPVLIGCIVLALGALVPAVTSRDEAVVMAASAALGFFFLPAFALMLDMCSTVAGEAAAGGATGLLMLFGNGGGVVVILAMELVKGSEPTFARAVTLMYVIVAAALALAFAAPETLARPARR
jgi:predicted MFS family arabinose efflux permease